MDPNKALQDARDALARLDALDGARGDIEVLQARCEDCATELIEAFRALDAWLTRGGFFPDAWLVKR